MIATLSLIIWSE